MEINFYRRFINLFNFPILDAQSEKQILMDLPSPIIIDIFSRLPTNKIIQCKSVSKTFFNLLSSPEFVKFHMSRSPNIFLVNHLYSWPPDSSFFNLVHVDDEPNRHDLVYMIDTKTTLLVGSINGLICLNEFRCPYLYDVVQLWNPTIKKFITIPMSKDFGTTNPHIISYGFGVTTKNDEYKVIRIFQENPNNAGIPTAQVFTLGSRSWRSIEHAPHLPDLPNSREHGIFLNGNLNWLVNDPDDTKLIYSLDLDNEQSRYIPPAIGLNKRTHETVTLNNYKGFLSLCDTTSETEMVIWVMREREQSWCKEVVIISYPKLNLPWQRIQDVHIVKVFEDGEILLSWDRNVIVSYDPRNKTLLKLDARDFIGASKGRTCLLQETFPSIEVVDYVPSFVSL